MAMLERGIYLARRGGALLSIVQTDEDLDYFKSEFDDVLKQYGELFGEAAKAIAA
jgi:glutamate-1-semialdehyde aminotransferase